MYNQTIATTTSFSPDGAEIGYTVRETTYQYFDLIYLILKFTIGFLIVFLFLKSAFKKRKR